MPQEVHLLFMILATQILRFLELEVFAAELYHQHIRHVPLSLRPLMQEFYDVETRHVTRFRALYEEVTHRRQPRCMTALFTARSIAYILAPFGWRTIFYFECWVERRAIKDYRAAMKWVEHPSVRRAIKKTLADEKRHTSYLKTLQTFCKDEELHIKQMKEALRQPK